MGNYKNFNPDQKTEYWSDHFKRWEESGLSQKKYCEQEKISYWSFRTWYYKIKSELTETKFIRMNTSCPEEKPSSKIIITLHGKIKIEFDENISVEILRKIFKAAEVLND